MLKETQITDPSQGKLRTGLILSGLTNWLLRDGTSNSLYASFCDASNVVGALQISDYSSDYDTKQLDDAWENLLF